MDKKRKLISENERRVKRPGDPTPSTNIMANNPVQWQLQMEKFSKRSQYILDNEIWTDCSFLLGVSEHQEIKANKMILAMSSPVFELMLYGPMSESKFPVRIEDIDPRDFRLFLQYVYTGKVSLKSFVEACGVWNAARKYMIPSLEKLCIDKIWDVLSPETACRVFEFAKFIEDKELEEQCIKIISLDTVTVLRDSSFEMIKTTTLETILDMDDLTISSELELFNALQKWAHRECERKAAEGATVTVRSVVSTTLPKVRFLTLGQNEIYDGIIPSVLLTDKEKLALLTKNAEHYPIPPEFSTNKSVRNGKGNGSPQNADKYSWIKNVQTWQPNKGTSSDTIIHFEVAKRIKIMGIEMLCRPERLSSQTVKVYGSSYTSVPQLLQHSSSEVTVDAVCIELQSACGKPVSISYFDETMMNSPGIVKINEGDYLERNKSYILKFTAFQLRSSSSNRTLVPSAATGTEKPWWETAIYHDLENLPIISILFT